MGFIDKSFSLRLTTQNRSMSFLLLPSQGETPPVTGFGQLAPSQPPSKHLPHPGGWATHHAGGVVKNTGRAAHVHTSRRQACPALRHGPSSVPKATSPWEVTHVGGDVMKKTVRLPFDGGYGLIDISSQHNLFWFGDDAHSWFGLRITL